MRSPSAAIHPFVEQPHRTLLRLSLPVLLSMIAEPLTGLVDTAFVGRLGAAPLAALGVATALLSSVFWIFNFLAIGTQTEVAGALGASEPRRAAEATAVALALALAVGVGLGLLGWPLAGAAVDAMGAHGEMHAPALAYLRIRLLGGAAVLLTVVAFGALRGIQDMRTPMVIAVAVNVSNAILCPLLIFGLGPLPALGVAGAAWATIASQWAGALWATARVRRALGLATPAWMPARGLLVTGFDLFVRTGSLIVFLLLATRAATQLGSAAGAAHQAIRQIWILTALVLDAYAATAQSLVGFFLGAGRVAVARRVAAVACAWSAGTGAALAVLMFAGTRVVEMLLVPSAALPAFEAAWPAAALAQPLNALSFATDGIHWGTADYRYLRNAMVVATVAGLGLLRTIPLEGASALRDLWLITAVWIAVRAGFGVARIWPGSGRAPLALTPPESRRT